MSATAEFTTASTNEELPAKRRLSPRTFASAMQVRSYRWWFGSQVLSASGTMMQAVAISWLVLKLSGSALLLSLTTSVMFLPLLVGGAWAGSLVDRMEPRRLLLLTQSVFLVLTTTFAVLVATTQVPVWVVFVFAFANGLVSTFDMPARQVFVLDLVGREHAANAVSLNEVVLNTSRILGPAVGGALLATVGVAICLFVNAFTFIPTIGVLLALIWRRGWSSKRETTPPPRRGHVREGLAYVWRVPAIRSCVLMAVAGGMLFNMGVTLPLLATRAFHAGPEGYGTMMATFGVGALFGAGLAAMGAPWPSGRKVRVLVAFTGAEVCLVAASPWIGLLYVGLALAGLLSIWYISLANALVQLRTPRPLQGRVMGVWTMALPGMAPLTSLLIGAVAASVAGGAGARGAFGLAGVAMLISAALGWRSLVDTEHGAVAIGPVVPMEAAASSP